MSAISKAVTAVALVATLAAGTALAGPMSCLPMQMMMSGPSGCGSQATPQGNAQACPVPAEKPAQEAACAGNGQDMGGTMASMASGGMNIATTVIDAIFGTPAR